MNVFKTTTFALALVISIGIVNDVKAAMSPNEIALSLVNKLPESKLMKNGFWQAEGRSGPKGNELTDVIGFRGIDDVRGAQPTDEQLKALTIGRRIGARSGTEADQIHLYLRPKSTREGANPNGVLFQLLVDSSRVGSIQRKYIQTYQILELAAKKAGLKYSYISSEAAFVANGEIRMKGVDDFQSLLMNIDDIIVDIEARGHEAVLGKIPDNVLNVNTYIEVTRKAPKKDPVW